jgi:dolichol-phosphate mannosyltransferase
VTSVREAISVLAVPHEEGTPLDISVVIPVCNEEENVGPLASEIAAALAGRAFEILFVDDGSTDQTAAAVLAARSAIPQVRLLRHSFRSGQSAAVTTGVRHARAEWVGTLDGDGQNDPADLPKLMAARLAPENAGVALFQGHRITRKDTGFRRLQSRVANGVRSKMLGDGTPDTGCGIKLMHRQTYLAVHHRPRARGTSKYGMLDRLWVGIVDIFGVMWLRRRYKPGLSVREE